MLANGQKALAPSGAALVGQEMKPDRSALGQVATGLLDVLPHAAHHRRVRLPPPDHQDQNAAVVAEGAAKPTGVYSVTRVEQSLVVVAHLTEGIPRFWLLDSTALASSLPAS